MYSWYEWDSTALSRVSAQLVPPPATVPALRQRPSEVADGAATAQPSAEADDGGSALPWWFWLATLAGIAAVQLDLLL